MIPSMRRDALRQLRRGGVASHLERVGVRARPTERAPPRRRPRRALPPRAPRAPRRSRAGRRAARDSSSAVRRTARTTATPSAASVARNTPPPTARERSGAPSRRASHSPARLFQRRSRIPVCHQSRSFVGMNCTSSALLTAPSSSVLSTGTKIQTRLVRFSWIVPWKHQHDRHGEPGRRGDRGQVAACDAEAGSFSSRTSASLSTRSRRAISSAERRSASVCPARNCRRA